MFLTGTLCGVFSNGYYSPHFAHNSRTKCLLCYSFKVVIMCSVVFLVPLTLYGVVESLPSIHQSINPYIYSRCYTKIKQRNDIKI